MSQAGNSGGAKESSSRVYGSKAKRKTESDHSCDRCNRRFRRIDSLKRHILHNICRSKQEKTRFTDIQREFV